MPVRRWLFVDHADVAAPDVTSSLVARTLVACMVAAPAMMLAAPTLAIWLGHQELPHRPLAIGVAGVIAGQCAGVLVSWWGLRGERERRLAALHVVTVLQAATMLVSALLPVLLPAPAGHAEVGLVYQLWIVGNAASMMAIAGAMTRMFVATSGVMLAIDTVVLAADQAGAPRMLAVLCVLYALVLALCQLSQREAMRQAFENGTRAQALLVQLSEANDRFRHDATHDLLTGIANRRRLLSALTEELGTLGHGAELTVLFLDLDGFKDVNDTYGHATGDRLLIAVAQRIVALTGDGDLVGRQGGDEFIVLVRSAKGAAVLELAERIRLAIEASFRIGEHLISVSASIGVVRCARGGIAPDDVLRDADLALYRAKDQGRNCVIEHRRDDSVRVDERPRPVRELRAALQEQAIRPYFQPIVDLETGAIFGAEALARWEQPDGTVLLPGAFLRALTEAGLDTDLGIHMALQIMTFRSEIAPLVADRFRIGLNVTLRRTRAKDLVDSLLVMRSMTTPNGRPVIEGMAIELNENAAVRDLEETSQELARARASGIGVALDDFGTGHSSLTLVRRLPLDAIKIDRAFVAGIADDRANQAVVSAVLEIARGVDANVVAEGVERVDDAIRLRELGCRYAQGFLYSPAVPGPVLAGWLRDGAPWQQPMPASERPLGASSRLEIRPH